MDVDLRKKAKGKDCTIRIPGICNYDPATTVLCHIRLPGITGAAFKAPDIMAARGCSACHDEVDRRTRILTKDEADLALLQGVMRTQAEYVKAGILKW